MSSQRDRQMNWSLAECNAYMLKNKVGCDVVILVAPPGESPQELSAHKYMLQSRSPVFETMLGGPWVEECPTENGVSKIKLTDVTYEAMKEFLRFLYCEEASLTGENVLSVLYASKKYMLHPLSDKCLAFLRENLDLNNVSHILNNAIVYDEDKMTAMCVRYIAKNFTKLIENDDSWGGLSQLSLNEIIKHDKVYVNNNESIVFKACMTWAQYQCSRKCGDDNKDIEKAASNNGEKCYSGTELREVLGDCFYRIRFPNMSPKVFIDSVEKFDVMTPEEKSEMHEYLVSEKCPSGGMRYDMGSRVRSCHRFQVQGKGWYNTRVCNGKPYAFGFECDIPIKLFGFSVYGTYENWPREYDIHVKIINDKRKVIAEVKEPSLLGIKNPRSYGSEKEIVFFDENILLESGQQYVISLVMSGPPTSYGTGGRTKIDSSPATFTFLRCKESGYEDSTYKGQIPQLFFVPVS